MKNSINKDITLPTPRPAINQGIESDNEMVLSHSVIYQNCLAQISDVNTLDNVLMTLNPYGTAPLSAYAGVWSDEVRTVVQICFQYLVLWLIPKIRSSLCLIM